MASAFSQNYNPYAPTYSGQVQMPNNTQASFQQQNGMWTIIAPDGTTQQVSGDQLGMGGQQQPGAGQQVTTAAGNIGGMTAGNAAANQLVGSSAGAAPATPTGLTGSFTGSSAASGAAPATPNIVQAGTAPTLGQTIWGTGEAASVATPTVVSGSPIAAGGSGWTGATGAAGGTLGSAAAVGAGAVTGYEQGMGAYHAVKNEPMSLAEQTALALPTFGFSYAYNPLRKMFGSRKGTEQLNRDAVRKMLKEKGFIDDKYQIQFDDGSFDIGKDGGEPWYNVDFTRPNIGGVVAAVQPLAAFIAGGDKKLTNDFAGYLTNAAMAGKDPMQRVQQMMDKTGMGHDQIYGAIHLMSQPGPNGEDPVLDQATADAYKNGLDQLYGVGAYEGQGPKFGTPPANLGIPQQKPGSGPVTGTPTSGQEGNKLSPAQRLGVNGATTPPPSGVQHPTDVKRSPFISSANYSGGSGIVGKQRISPGVWADAKGQYLSKTGQR